MRKCRCFRLLILVLPVENPMLSIANLMVDARCVATTGGSRLFCMQNSELSPVVAIHPLVTTGSPYTIFPTVDLFDSR
jgi:hypothetical protein